MPARPPSRARRCASCTNPYSARCDSAARAPTTTVRVTSAQYPSTTAPKSSSSQSPAATVRALVRSEEHTSELQSPCNLVCRLLLEKKKKVLIDCTLHAVTSDVSAKLLDLVGLVGKSAADKGKDTRDYLAAAFPELNAWERAGADDSSAGMVDAGFENQKELTKILFFF